MLNDPSRDSIEGRKKDNNKTKDFLSASHFSRLNAY